MGLRFGSRAGFIAYPKILDAANPRGVGPSALVRSF